jgi:hypothetical protein
MMDSNESPVLKQRVSLVLDDMPESPTKFRRPMKRRNTECIKPGGLSSFLSRLNSNKKISKEDDLLNDDGNQENPNDTIDENKSDHSE